MHKSVMLQESIEALNIIPDGIYIDGTFGRGGHSAAIVSHLGEAGRLICCDKDPEAIAYGEAAFAGDQRVSFHNACFSQLKNIVNTLGIAHQVNGILLDLGVSSPQLDQPHRGFSFMRDGPLDMRMDNAHGLTAHEWLQTATQKDIAMVLKRYGEEPFAARIATRICEVREQTPITTTLALAKLVSECIPAKYQKPHHHPATKTFQAIRLHVNQELPALENTLSTAEKILAPQGRLAIISFHSLEDRQVKQYISARTKVTLPRGISLPESALVPPWQWIAKRQFASSEEVAHNPRARSATLRVAEMA